MDNAEKSGIYFIRNKETGSAYVGSTLKSFKSRWSKHKSMLRNNSHPNKFLQNAWNKYGEKAFVFDIAEVIIDTKQMIEREQYWMDVFFTANKSYNLRPKSESNAGCKWKWSQKSREKLSIIVKEYMSDPEYYKKWYAARNRPEVNKRLSDAAKKRWQNADFKQKMSQIKSRKIWDGFISPEGIEYRNVKNLRKFCEDHNVSYDGIRNLIYAKISNHKGGILVGKLGN